MQSRPSALGISSVWSGHATEQPRRFLTGSDAGNRADSCRPLSYRDRVGALWPMEPDTLTFTGTAAQPDPCGHLAFAQ
jgi:hypothetical protein